MAGAPVKQHASGWRRIDTDDANAPSDDIRQALQLSQLLRQLVSHVDAGTGRSLLRLSERGVQALRRREARERELLDGLGLASTDRDRLQVELEKMSQFCEDFEHMQRERDDSNCRVDVLERELSDLKEECCTLRRRLASMQRAFREVRQHRDQLLDELGGLQAEIGSQSKLPSALEESNCQSLERIAESEESKLYGNVGALTLAVPGSENGVATSSRAIVLPHGPGQTPERTGFLFTESGRDDASELEEETCNLPLCIQNIAVRFILPAAAGVQHVAMMLVFHHGYLQNAAAHAANTFMSSLGRGSQQLLDDEGKETLDEKASPPSDDDPDQVVMSTSDVQHSDNLQEESSAHASSQQAQESSCSAGVQVGTASLRLQLARADITSCHTVQARDLQHSAGRPISSKQGCQRRSA